VKEKFDSPEVAATDTDGELAAIGGDTDVAGCDGDAAGCDGDAAG
jgi:hypothetical protein